MVYSMPDSQTLTKHAPHLLHWLCCVWSPNCSLGIWIQALGTMTAASHPASAVQGWEMGGEGLPADWQDPETLVRSRHKVGLLCTVRNDRKKISNCCVFDRRDQRLLFQWGAINKCQLSHFLIVFLYIQSIKKASTPAGRLGCINGCADTTEGTGHHRTSMEEL